MAGRHAIVAGGGIGGLATAIALIRRGWQVEVLERTPAIGEVGSGLSLWPNGLRSLDALGLGEQVRAFASADAEAGFRRPTGDWLAKSDTAELTRRYGPMVGVYRADLYGILRAALPESALRLGITVTAVRDDAAEPTVVHSGGVDGADLVVGADGIRSAVRQALWPRARGPR